MTPFLIAFPLVFLAGPADSIAGGEGLTSALFCMAGHYAGSGMLMKQGSRIVRPVILAVLALLLLKSGAELAGIA